MPKERRILPAGSIPRPRPQRCVYMRIVALPSPPNAPFKGLEVGGEKQRRMPSNILTPNSETDSSISRERGTPDPSVVDMKSPPHHPTPGVEPKPKDRAEKKERDRERDRDDRESKKARDDKDGAKGERAEKKERDERIKGARDDRSSTPVNANGVGPTPMDIVPGAGPPKDHRAVAKSANSNVSSRKLVLQDVKQYKPIAGEGPLSEETLKSVRIEYPGASDAYEEFALAVPGKPEEYDPIHDLGSTVYRIVTDCLDGVDTSGFGDRTSGTLRAIIKACKRRNAADIVENVEAFNALMLSVKQSYATVLARNEGLGPPANRELIEWILEQSTSRVVSPNVHALKEYKEFSNNVYGEVKPILVSEIIDKAGIQPHHCFLDMGSGTGNVVLQVAAQTLCEAYGIEVMENPSNLARKLRVEFLTRMRMYSKPCGKVRLKKGDFLEDDEVHSVIKRADIIFVNNYAYDAELNQKILQRFLDLKDTAKVISLKSLVPIGGRQNGRRSNAIETIFSVKEYIYPQNYVSWMSTSGSYFIHTVNR